MRSIDDTIGALAAPYDLVTITDLRKAGIDIRAIRRREAASRLHRVEASVYSTNGPDLTWERAFRAALLAVPGSVGSHRTSARALEVPNADRFEDIDVTICSEREHILRHASVHRTMDLRPESVVLVRGLPVTDPLRTIVDLGAVLPPAAAVWTIHAAMVKFRLTVAEVDAEVELVARQGRAGVGAARTAIATFVPEMYDTESELERAFYRVVVEYGLPVPTPQFRPPWSGKDVQRIDAAYPERRLLIELDSLEHHTDLDAFERDRRRDQLAASRGWRTLRFTWTQVTTTPWLVASTILDALGTN